MIFDITEIDKPKLLMAIFNHLRLSVDPPMDEAEADRVLRASRDNRHLKWSDLEIEMALIGDGLKLDWITRPSSRVFDEEALIEVLEATGCRRM